MAYTSLYRNFRPIKFNEMVGQDHITRTLKNQLIANRVGHAYLFTGGRGTGKTTSAKILARAVNCLNPQDGEPCNECEICKEILDGSLTDVVEMDAASNNGVEDVRAIREEVNFLPTKAKYRVYIIDEVHMLSTGAFNALLKTLEEPPSHVKFILATTEPQKLPMTILSRCQRFDFKQIPVDDIIKRLKIICEEINISADDDALNLISVLSEGHMRDAISILERCSQETDSSINIETVKELVGIPQIEYINNIANAIVDKDAIKALENIDIIIKDGKDLYNILWEIIKYFKDILVFKATNKVDIYSEEEIQMIKEISGKVSSQKLLEIIYSLSDIENDIKWSSQRTIMFQTGIIKICKMDEVVRTKEVEVIKTAEKVVEPTQKSNSGAQQVPSKTINTNQAWTQILANIKNNGKIRLHASLINAKVEEESDLIWKVTFGGDNPSFNKSIIEVPDNYKTLEEATFMVVKKKIHYKFVYGNVNNDNSKKSESSTINNFGIDINIID